MQNHWLHLTPDTFLWKKQFKGLVYNSHIKNGFVFNITDELRTLICELDDLSNLYCIPISAEQIKCKDVNNFINRVKEVSGGGLLPVMDGTPKPVFLVPLLNLQSDVERLRKVQELSIGTNVLTYLHKLHIQIMKCRNENLDFIKLNHLLQSTRSSGISEIFVSGDGLFNYHFLDKVLGELDSTTAMKTFCVSLDEFPVNLDRLKFLQSRHFRLRITVPGGFGFSYIDDSLQKLKYKGISNEWEFLVTSAQEYQQVRSIIDFLQFENSEIKPVYTDENLKFFEDYIYLTEEDLINSGLNKREVFAHQVLNTYDFGNLIILPDGNIHANIYHEPLGSIDDDIREIIYKEMERGTSWRRIRNMKPCCDCVYQWLCPSPSNYELAIGKPNLCHVK